MHKTLSLLALALSCTGAFAACDSPDKWTGVDKAKHFAVGMAAGATVATVSSSTWVGFGAGVALGLAKEAYDSRHPQSHHCSVQDFAATAAGAAVGALAANWLVIPHTKGATLMWTKRF